MPAYQNTFPPISLMPGDVGFSFNNEAFPGSAQAGSQFAIPGYGGRADTGNAVRWQTVFGTAPTAVNLTLQGAMADVDAEYQVIDTTTNTAGHANRQRHHCSLFDDLSRPACSSVNTKRAT